jgi:hypothetical protein
LPLDEPPDRFAASAIGNPEAATSGCDPRRTKTRPDLLKTMNWNSRIEGTPMNTDLFSGATGIP